MRTHIDPVPWVQIAGQRSANQNEVELTWPSMVPERLRFSSYWLRLYSRSSALYRGVADRWTDGANFRAAALEAAESYVVKAEISTDGTALQISWADGHRGSFSVDWLRQMAVRVDPVEQVHRVPWDANTMFSTYDYGRLLRDDEYLFSVLHCFLVDGLVFVGDAPRHERAVVDLANRIGTLEPSHLGETFHILVGSDPAHIGETADAIPPHIDLVYKQTPPRVQMLHALCQVDQGGENVFVDGLRAVAELDVEDVRRLSTTPLWFVAESATVHFRGFHPVLKHRPDGQLAGIYYNEYKTEFPTDVPVDVYQSFRRFEHVIARPDLQLSVLLQQDGIVILDNQRTLHGRRAFRGGKRHLVGCFVSDDDLRSRYRTLVYNGHRPDPIPT